ncbi:MAG: DUF5343 domain-containing protein [Dongiaceae bacterium]
MPVTADKAAPYAPTKTILDVIGRYRTRGMTSPINAEVLARAGIPESLIARTFQALQALDLVDEQGKPTSTLEGIRVAPQAEYQSRLAEWLRTAYTDIFAFVDPGKDDEVRVRDAFRTYQPVGQQARMVTLFLGLCAAAGLTPERSQQPKAQMSQRLSSSPPQIKRNVSKRNSSISSGHGVGIPAPLLGLLGSLPTSGSGWTKRDRDKFLVTFGAVLDFCFPILTEDTELEETKTAAS